ncbi:sugar ABC transporter ATP-binding protein [Neobacillus drentensis]|uniref:sugar ABC transporter ATP-binding protein n=1 Tax=Neobacillus drentensis TaxID=220684 RepID=UPI001F3DA355|nr:sugar ABC transporter ATP-binding protein [Neobacillus drentensis]ULT59671.1 sugar ABC transporter ATP-binding protein [Neobacillus drentensis]
MQGIVKSFPGVKALSNVDFTLCKGEIHALMGENGAGKSTLIKVLTGVHELDSGKIVFNNKNIRPKSPQEAQKLGISTVYQEVNLCPNLTVAENIFIGRLPKKKRGIDWNLINEKSKEILRRVNLDIDPTQMLSSFSVAIQQMIAIARAVDISAGILILDEPTASLDENEVKQLFKIMRKLKEDGMGIIFVTHFLDQVYEVTDRITILRNGNLVGEFMTKELSRIDLVTKMVGREINEKEHNLENRKRRRSSEKIDTMVKAVGLGKKGTLEPFDMEMKKGEVLGLAGLLGSGRTETARLIFGIDRADNGVVNIDGKDIQLMYPKKAIEEGMGYCPEDRKKEGIVGELTIRENIILALQAKRGSLRYISKREQVEIANKYIKMLQIATPSMEQQIRNLSGGNQQKVILARWLATNPKLLILDEPTRGIDVGTRTEIQKLIRTLANEGMTVLLISSELEELVACCDRIVVLRDRTPIGQLQGDEITESVIMKTIADGGKVNAS